MQSSSNKRLRVSQETRIAMWSESDVFIVGAKRTPCGAFQGLFSDLTASELGAVTHRAVLEQAQVEPSAVDEVLTGCVLQAAQGQGPARQAAIKAGLPFSTATSTINKMCGSGMVSVMLGCNLIKAGDANIVLAGGMESMTQAPHLIQKARAGFRLGHGEIKDHLLLDGLEDAFERGKLMGCFADETAANYSITREQQDEYAALSMQRASDAHDSGAFAAEIAPVTVNDRKRGEVVISRDEAVDTAKIAKLARLRPAFSPSGTATAGNSSSIADGAASILLMGGATLNQRSDLQTCPLARIVAFATHGQEPNRFTTAPVGAVRKVLAKAGWSVGDVDLFEINEAFAVVTLASMQELGVPVEKVNIYGGACAIGHPIGASGARILVTLINALRTKKMTKGIAVICIGGGESTAMALDII